jgi:ubiquitin carboxyl-terminal hydrolase 25/28
LHAIIIHDGLAENGHYYTYVFDRIKKLWWKLNDHRVSQEKEEVVMKESFGGDGYKSACNLFYISKQVADQIDKNNFKAVYIAE